MFLKNNQIFFSWPPGSAFMAGKQADPAFFGGQAVENEGGEGSF
jgi:hypothetical protein